ncbi:MAG TPA: signal recognition particle protein [Acidimicrobiia bacterium]|nr:signal recognition particle protein [Acidimicrobiia bacterium]
MFEQVSGRFEAIFDRLRGRGRLDESSVDAALREVRLALLEADVNVGVARTFLDRVRERAVGSEVHQSLTPAQAVIKIVHEELVTTLGQANAPLRSVSPPLVILIAGLQGSGKTTTAAKLAKHLKGNGRRPLLVAADLQRPAAVEQLQTLGARIDVPVYTERTSRPPRLVRAALREATRLSLDTVIIDTAGRLQIDRELMGELAAIDKEAKPHETLLVVDALTGQEAVNVAQGFKERVALTGLILTKLDGDARGGAAISVREVTGVPIKFAGVGEGIDGLEAFHPERMASRILGMGDVLTLIEKAEQTFDQEQAEKASAKMQKGEFTLEDFLEQFSALKRMGPLKDVLAMIPGSGSLLKQVNIEDRDLQRLEGMIRSMTPAERRNPKLISGSRKRRIAAGSGRTPTDVNQLLKQFGDAQRMMKMMSGGKGMPSLAGISPAARARPPTHKKAKKKSKGRR